MITEILTLLFLTMRITVQSGDNIPELTFYESKIAQAAGSTLRIECPIRAQNSDIGSNGLMFSWSVRDVDENMVATDTRYSFINGSRIAIIKNVKPADSGVYKCRGVTGFGSQEATFYVNILDHQSCLATYSSSNKSPQRPCFLDPTMQNSMNKVLTIHKNVGSSVEFRCDSAGNPKPSYVWIMGKSIASWINTVEDARQPVLTIKNLRIEYTGHYTCRVSNIHGKISFTFALVVKESPEGLPKITEEMQNTTAVIGSSVELIGSISCKCDPIIQWLQRDDKQFATSKQRRNIISLPQATPSEVGEFYMTVDNDLDHPSDDSSRIETVRQSNGLIISKLKFSSVKPWHTGKYVLLTMSKEKSSVHEIHYKTVFLEVLPDKLMKFTDKTNSPPKIIVYIAVPLGILIICVFIVFYCFLRRKSTTGRHSNICEQSLKSKRSGSSNNHSMSATGTDTASKACIKHTSYGNTGPMTLTTSIHSNTQYTSSRLNDNINRSSPYLIQAPQKIPGPTLVPAPSSNSSISNPNSCHKISRNSNHSSSNDSTGIVKVPPLAPPSNSPYSSYSSNPVNNYYHQYNQPSACSVPSNNPSLLGNCARENSSNSSDFSSTMKQKINQSNQSIDINNHPTMITSLPLVSGCQCTTAQYCIPDVKVNHEQSFELPPSLCFDNGTNSYLSNQYQSTAAYFPGHNSSSSASLTYS